MKMYFKCCIWFQIHEEARKFSFQTGVKVVVAYGGAPINQQVYLFSLYFSLYFSLCFSELVMSPRHAILIYTSIYISFFTQLCRHLVKAHI